MPRDQPDGSVIVPKPLDPMSTNHSLPFAAGVRDGEFTPPLEFPVILADTSQFAIEPVTAQALAATFVAALKVIVCVDPSEPSDIFVKRATKRRLPPTVSLYKAVQPEGVVTVSAPPASPDIWINSRSPVENPEGNVTPMLDAPPTVDASNAPISSGGGPLSMKPPSIRVLFPYS